MSFERIDIDANLAQCLATTPALRCLSVAIDAPHLGAQIIRGVDRHGVIDDAAAARPFRIASVTKPFVAAAIHKLALMGRVSIWDRVAIHASENTVHALRRGGFDTDAITIAHLLSHTSGLIDHSDTPDYAAAVADAPHRRWTRHEQLSLAVVDGAKLGAPGAVYSYSDTSYIILGEVVERLSGQPLESAIPRLLEFDRIGLSATWWEAADNVDGRAALAEQWIDNRGFRDADPSFDLYGGGGIVSTVGDLARFIRALMTGALLPTPHLAAALVTPQSQPQATAVRTHNYLLSSMKLGERWCHGHTGFWGSAMVYCAELDIAIAATANQSGPAGIGAVRDLIATVLERLAADRLLSRES